MIDNIIVKRDGKGKIYSYIRNQWLIETPEERVRQNLIVRLVNEYGYPLENMIEECKTEYRGRGVRRTRADIVIFKTKEDMRNNHNAYIVIECKSENVKIHLEDFYQGTEYAAKLRSTFLLLHNEKETHYYKVNPNMIPNVEDAFEQINGIPKYSEIHDKKRVKEIMQETKKFTRKDFTDLLSACHNIIRNNDKLSPESAFDEISKILFMKIRYERGEKGSQIFTLEQYKEIKKAYEKVNKNVPNLKPYMQYLFEQTKQEFAQDKLFEENDELKIRENSFEAILKKLEKYNLSDTSDDIKGIAFEEFLGRTFRGELGQFFTPRTIVEFMTNILDPQEGEIICDPCCGSGGFLINAFEHIRKKIEDDVNNTIDVFRQEIEKDYDSSSEDEQISINERVEKMQAIMRKEEDMREEDSRMHALANNCIFGTDANPRMARVSKMNMIMHGDGHCGVHHHDGLLNVNGIFEERFDVILTNPPFGARIGKDYKITEADKFNDKLAIKEYEKKYGKDYTNALKQVNDNINKPLLKLYDLGSTSGLTEVLFMERCLHLLKKGGRMGIVLPEGVLNTSSLQKVRDYFEGKAKILLICSIPQDVFIKAGATVKPSLVFFKKFTQEEENIYRDIKKNAKSEIEEKYKQEFATLKAEKKLLNAKEYKSKEKTLLSMQEEEIKQLIKERFDYEIPIAKVDYAGINTTGGECENQLIDVEKEFGSYNQINKLWVKKKIDANYQFKSGFILRDNKNLGGV